RLTEINVRITEGTFQDAEWLALGANKMHGFNRTNADKRRAVELALGHPKAGKLSSRGLAKHCGVSHQFVENIRAICQPLTDKRTVTRNNTTYTQNTANIGRTKKSQTAKLTDETKIQLLLTDLDQNQSEIKRLAKLPEDIQAEVVSMIAAGKTSSVSGALLTLADKRKLQIAQRMRDTSADKKEYNVILADPPWEYDNNIKQWGPASLHYTSMSIPDIAHLPEAIDLRIADNAVLFLWVTNPFLQDAFNVVSAWGFQYKTNMVWVKTNLQRPGSGFYIRGRHELLFICTKGSFTPLNKNITPPIGSVISLPVSRHSSKPEEIYELIETLYPGCSYIELFARQKRDQWDTWGNETDNE
ncbi:MAG: MT-A70 family methyltransferase, partial [Planctomycetota bacterium]